MWQSLQCSYNSFLYEHFYILKLKTEMLVVFYQPNIPKTVLYHCILFSVLFYRLQTLFSVSSSITPAKTASTEDQTEAAEQCKVGHLASINVTVCCRDNKMALDAEQQYMYDVITEPNTWAVSGKNSGKSEA